MYRTDKIRFTSTGNPPDRYDVIYTCKGLVDVAGAPVEASHFSLTVILGPDYPRAKPAITVHERVFHPNFSGSNVCIAAGEWRAGESLADLIIRIGRMIQYHSYNPNHPLNSNYATWAKQNPQRFPIDPEPLLLDYAQLVRPISPSAGTPPRSQSPGPRRDRRLAVKQEDIILVEAPRQDDDISFLD